MLYKLLLECLLFETPSRTIDLVRLVSSTRDARRYVVEELDSLDNTYVVVMGDDTLTTKRINEFMPWVEMALEAACDCAIAGA